METRETEEDRPGNHVGTKSVSLQELRTPSAEAVWGKMWFGPSMQKCGKTVPLN